MKILMLTPYLPYPPASGGQIRTLYLLKYLSQNHEITLVSLYKNEHEKKYARHLGSYCKNVYLCKRASKPWQVENVLKAVFSALPFLIVRNFSPEAKQTVKKLLTEQSFDVIHAETFYIMPHIPETKTPILLVEQTIEYKVYQHYISSLPFYLRIPLSLDIAKLKYWEKYYWNEADMVATVSESDKDEIRRLIPHVRPAIVPNGAGDEMFVDRFDNPDKKNPILLFVGNFYWLQNVEAAEYLIEQVFPAVQQLFPGIHLVIAGQNSEKIKKHIVKNLSIVQLEPNASNKVKELYHSATLFIAPIFGPGGTRLKILAGMASGLPVISTKTGVEGLEVRNNIHFLIAKTPQEFASEIARILHDKPLYKKIQRNAYDHVKSMYSWESIAQGLDTIYRRITKHSKK